MNLSMNLSTADLLTAIDAFIVTQQGGHIRDTTKTLVFNPDGSVTVSLKQ